MVLYLGNTGVSTVDMSNTGTTVPGSMISQFMIPASTVFHTVPVDEARAELFVLTHLLRPTETYISR